MSAEIIQFVPRPSNYHRQAAERAFWLGPMAMVDLQIASIAIMGDIIEQTLRDEPTDQDSA